MAAKVILVFCAQALFIQSTFSQCLSPAAIDVSRFATPIGYDGLALDAWPARGLGITCGPIIETTPTSGGGLFVTSGSGIPPVGLSLTSENLYEGILSAAGELPFVGTVEVDGVVPTAGTGAVNYGCGNGVTAMASETIPPAAAFSSGFAAAGSGGFGARAFAPAAHIAAPGLDYRAGWVGRGCGCGL